MIDGYSGKVCDYTFVATEGVAMPLEVNPGPTINICYGEQVEVTATGGSGNYTWDTAPGLSSTTGSPVTITAPSADGTYTYTVHSDGGTAICPESDTYNLSVIVAPCCNIDAQVTSTTCDGPNGTYDATLTVSFENPPSTENLVINACDGSQQVIPVGAIGSSPYITTIPGLDLTAQNCSIEAYFSGSSNCTHVLTYTPNATETPTFTNPGPVCPGTPYTLSTSSIEGITGTWSPAINNTQTTTYTFTPTAGSCAVPTTMTVVVSDEIVPTFVNPGPICPDSTYTLPSTSINGISGTWSPAINSSQTTTYTFTPTSSNCAIPVTMTVETDLALCLEDPLITLPNVFTPNGDNVNDFYEINTAFIEQLDYWILNRWGDLIYQSDNLTSFWNGKVGGNDAAEGVYFIIYKARGLNGKILEGHTFFHLER